MFVTRYNIKVQQIQNYSSYLLLGLFQMLDICLCYYLNLLLHMLLICLSVYLYTCNYIYLIFV